MTTGEREIGARSVRPMAKSLEGHVKTDVPGQSSDGRARSRSAASRASRRELRVCGRPYEKGRSSSGDSSWYSSWSDVCHKTSLGCRCPIPIVGDSCPSSTATVFGSSSFHLSMERRRAFMKKLPTVVGSRPSCLAIVTCISFDGLLVSCGTGISISTGLRLAIVRDGDWVNGNVDHVRVGFSIAELFNSFETRVVSEDG